MTRSEAIQRIVCCLLRHADRPIDAVAAAQSLYSCLGEGQEREITFKNLLRAAGLFAKDDDGYFMRYRNNCATTDETLLELPKPNYLLIFPVPTEPRMRIAYNVFAGLLLKYIYQTYGSVPTEMEEGMARLYTENGLPDALDIWDKFKRSTLIARALNDGLEGTLNAIGNIGGIEMTETMAQSALLASLLTVLPRFSSKFLQGGMRLNFYYQSDIDKWIDQHNGNNNSTEPVEELWLNGWQDGTSINQISEQITVRIIRDLDRQQPLEKHNFVALWRGEGSGTNRKRGLRETLSTPNNKKQEERAKLVDNEIVGLLSQLDAHRHDTRELHDWVKKMLNSHVPSNRLFTDLLNQASSLVRQALNTNQILNHAPLDVTPLVNDIDMLFRQQTVSVSLKKQVTGHLSELRSAIVQTLKICIAIRLAHELDGNVPVAIFDWRVATLRHMPHDGEWVLRFLKKKSIGGNRIVEIRPFRPFGNIKLLETTENDKSHVPFQCYALDNEHTATISTQPLLSGQRCIVCGSPLDLLKGSKSFLPETKKRYYDIPTREELPLICSNCAFIAYLSSVYPSSDLSIVEFPTDNFLELFALYESLQGISAIEALKYINRVASLSVFPNRYLLLSHNKRRGKLDSKSQVYLQLRDQVHLLKQIERPMRVQIEGSIPQMWSEILSHIPIGLSHFKELPPYYESKSDRKGFAYEVVRALQEGQPYTAFYCATKYAEDKKHPYEQRVFVKSLDRYEHEFVRKYAHNLAKSLGGEKVKEGIYNDIIEFSNYLHDLLRNLVDHEVKQRKTSVSGVARKYTDLIIREFGEQKVNPPFAGKFQYVICQEANDAERDGDRWLKRKLFQQLYGETVESDNLSMEERAQAYEAIRERHPCTVLEEKLIRYRNNHGEQYAIWQKFLREVQARTLALLMLNVRHISESEGRR